MKTPSILDHIVINVRFDMDGAQARFTDLGFTLTPRGYHTLGSCNHLMMFGRDYLELVGVPEDAAERRPELARAPVGLNGLVFKSEDVDATYAHLQSVGLAGDPPKSFSRPVILSDGSEHDARFRTVAVRADQFPAGRLYFCEHQTPELLWRREWQSHSNGVTGFKELLMVADKPDVQAALVCRAIGSTSIRPGRSGDQIVELAADTILRIQSSEAHQEQLGRLAGRLNGRQAMFGSLAFHGNDIVSFRQSLDTAGTSHETESNGSVTVSIEELDTLLIFALKDGPNPTSVPT